MTIGTPAGNNGFDDDLAFNPILDEPSTPKIDDLPACKADSTSTTTSKENSDDKSSGDKKNTEKENVPGEKVLGHEKACEKGKVLNADQNNDKADSEKKRGAKKEEPIVLENRERKRGYNKNHFFILLPYCIIKLLITNLFPMTF